jgi:hypothetical protein
MIRDSHTVHTLAIAMTAGLVWAAPLAAQDAPGGNYEGTVLIGDEEVAFTLTIQDEDDGPAGFFSMPAQGMLNVPVSELLFEEAGITFALDVGEPESVVFEGNRDGEDLSGTLMGPVPEGSTWTASRVGAARPMTDPLIVEPTDIEIEAGDRLTLEVRGQDSEGNPLEPEDVRFFVPGSRGLVVNADGEVEAVAGGAYTIIVLARVGDVQVRRNVPATVTWPPIEEVRLTGLPDVLHDGNVYRVGIAVITEKGLERDDVAPVLRSSNPAVVGVSAGGSLYAVGVGTATITAAAEGVERTQEVSVEQSPVRAIEIAADRDRARTGDVVHVSAAARDDRGRDLADAPIAWSVEGFPIDTLIAPPAAAHVDERGRFVAEKPGTYVIRASSGRVGAAVEVRVEGREVAENVQLSGQGTVSEVHTSDLWVWEGVDGRDYAITGTWAGEGKAYFWDVTDPQNIVKIDSVQVDARTVNDVKVASDGRIAVISREGASDRRNGIVLYDVSDPRNVTEVGRYDEGLTGGVHNVFIHDDHVYALSAGQRYDILNIENPSRPVKVGSFELDAPGHSIHDVWVEDGIAYSSNWRDGVVLVDVGNGIAGGSPENPVQFAQYAYPSGANHAAFPYRSESTGRFYVIAGDEIMPGFDPDQPAETMGYLHFIDFTDPENPVEVARYQVPEAGTHNLWVEGDRLYAAFYNGGLRVIDISGELRGDLYRQGREIARYRAYDPEGKVANAPMTWGPQPHKGHVFFSEFNSGLWAVKLEPRRELVP